MYETVRMYVGHTIQHVFSQPSGNMQRFLLLNKCYIKNQIKASTTGVVSVAAFPPAL